MAFRIALVGHSFIRRLETNPQIDLNPPGKTIKLFHSSTIKTMIKNNVPEQVFTFDPHIIFLQIGGNDINPQDNYSYTAFNIFSLLELFTSRDYTVIIGEVMARPYPNPAFNGITPADYNTARQGINQILRRSLSASRKKGTIPPGSHLLTFHLNDPAFFPDGTHFDQAKEVVYWNKIYERISTTLINTYSTRFLLTNLP